MNNNLIIINSKWNEVIFSYFPLEVKIFDNYINLDRYKKSLKKNGINAIINSEGKILWLQIEINYIEFEELINGKGLEETLQEGIRNAWINYCKDQYIWKTSKRDIKINLGYPLIMGVLNVTPDSFYDGGKFIEVDKAVEYAMKLEEEGADIIDIGGQSTRPSSVQISADEELNRVIPIIEKLSKLIKIPMSIDTYYAKVAEEAMKNGVEIINDISAFTINEEAMIEVANKYRAGICLMHYYKTLQPMPSEPYYSEVIYEIIMWLKERVNLLCKNNIDRDRITIDPGVGFGKLISHNLQIMNRLDELRVLGLPVLIGPSRKSFIGKILNDKGPEDRLAGTISSCILAMFRGASILRVHDVKDIRRSIRIAHSIINGV